VIPRIFILCFLGAFLEGADFQIAAIAVPKIALDWGRRPPDFAAVFSMTSLGSALGTVLIGWITDRFGRKSSFVLSLVGLGLFTLAACFTTTIVGMTAWRFLGGICLGGTLVTIVTIVSDNSKPENRIRDTMLIYTGTPFGAMVCSLAGGVILKTFNDWKPIFYLGGGLPLLLAACVVLVLPEPRSFVSARSKLQPGEADSGVFDREYFARTMALWFTELISLSAIFLLTSWLPTILAKATGSLSGASYYTSLIYFGSIIGTIILAALIRKTGPYRLMTGVFAFAAVVSIVLNSAVQHPGTLLLVGLVVLGIGLVGGHITLNTLAAGIYPVRIRGRGIGLAMGAGRCGALIGPGVGAFALVSPVLKDSVFLVLAAMVALSALSIVVLAYYARPMQSPPLAVQP
jgi:MFS family permease